VISGFSAARNLGSGGVAARRRRPIGNLALQQSAVTSRPGRVRHPPEDGKEDGACLHTLTAAGWRWAHDGGPCSKPTAKRWQRSLLPQRWVLHGAVYRLVAENLNPVSYGLPTLPKQPAGGGVAPPTMRALRSRSEWVFFQLWRSLVRPDRCA